MLKTLSATMASRLLGEDEVAWLSPGSRASNKGSTAVRAWHDIRTKTKTQCEGAMFRGRVKSGTQWPKLKRKSQWPRPRGFLDSTIPFWGSLSVGTEFAKAVRPSTTYSSLAGPLPSPLREPVQIGLGLGPNVECLRCGKSRPIPGHCLAQRGQQE